MSRGKYVVPVIMGSPGSEMYVVKGDVPKGQNVVLAKLSMERGLSQREIKIAEGFVANGKMSSIPVKLRELDVVTGDRLDLITDVEAALIQGYIDNTLPGAFRAPQINPWFLFEKPGDITPLKLARFSINLLSKSDRNELIGWMRRFKPDYNNHRYASYR